MISSSIGRQGRIRWDQFASTIVSLAIAFDWLPGYALHISSGILSLTRWVAVPLMLLSIIIEPNAYVRVIARKEVIVLVLATIMGIGGGVAAGNVAMGTLVSFMPNCLAVIFYRRQRDVSRLRGILLSLLIGSWVLCGIVVLAGFGLLPSGLAVVGQDLGGAVFARTWAGVSSSLLGPWVGVLLGTLGGFALDPQDSRLTVLVGLSMVVSVLVAFVTAQRSIIIIVVLSFLLGAASVFRRARRRKMLPRTRGHLKWNAVLVVLSILILFTLSWPSLQGRSATLRYRFASMQTTADAYGGALRLYMWKYLAHDVLTSPKLIAPGDKGMFAALNAGPHLLLGESYYYGGFLMLIAMMILIYSSVRSSCRAARWPASSEWAFIAGVIVSVLVPTLVYLMVMPGFVSRLPYVFMGMAMALPSARSSGQHVRNSDMLTKRVEGFSVEGATICSER